MKKILYPFVLAALVFSGCSDDDNAGNGGDNGSDDLRKITVKRSEIDNLASTTAISQVRLVVSYGNDLEYDLITADWNNGFAMTLPATVNDAYLTNIVDLWNEDGYDTSDVLISNTNAKITAETMFETYNNTTHTGYLYVGDDEDDRDKRWEIMYLYSDRDVTVKGTRVETDGDNTYQDEYDVTLKQGWNRVASRLTPSSGKYLYQVKTNLPNKLHWYFTTEM